MNEGVITHRILQVFEELSAGFQARGASKSYADYNALIAAFIIEGWPPSEAEKFARTHLIKKAKTDECSETN
jgi:hypothetical protein